MLNAQQNIRREESTLQLFSSLPCHSCHVTNVYITAMISMSQKSPQISKNMTLSKTHDSDFQSGRCSIKTKQNRNIP